MTQLPDSISEAAQAFKAGDVALLVDDLSTPAVGYLVSSAVSASRDVICKMVNLAKGIICAALTEERAYSLGLRELAQHRFRHGPDFLVSVEAREGVSTGISADDRAATIRALALSDDGQRDLVSPGHLFPILAKPGGSLVQLTVAEALCDLLRICQQPAVGAYCHCLDDAGEVRTFNSLVELQTREKLPLVKFSEVINFRLGHEQIVKPIATATIPVSGIGDFQTTCFESTFDNTDHLALTLGLETGASESTSIESPVLCRVHTENQLADVLGIGNSPRRSIALGALQAIRQEGLGVFILVRHPLRGNLAKSVLQLRDEAAAKQSPLHTLREFGIGAQILRLLGVRRIRLLSNNANPIEGIEAFGLELVERVPFSLLKPQMEAANL